MENGSGSIETRGGRGLRFHPFLIGEFVKIFEAHSLILAIKIALRRGCLVGHLGPDSDVLGVRKVLADLHPEIGKLRDCCLAADLKFSAKAAERLFLFCTPPVGAEDVVVSVASFELEVSRVAQLIADECSDRLYFSLDSDAAAKYLRPFDGWEPILEVFPEAQDDVEQMNKCRAFECDSASVFHVLLVMEFGLIALGKFVGVKDQKPGWNATCNAVEKILKEGRTDAGPHILAHFAFLEQINKDMHSMKLAWRNKVSHAVNNLSLLTSDFKPEVANKIITAVHGFMLLLATEGPLGKSDEAH
jgi:hypothetical protein